MMRLAAAVLVGILAALPLTVRPFPPVTWLAVAVLVVGGAAVAALSVPLVTAGASLALIAYALAVVIAQPPVDPVTAIVLGATVVLLMGLVHFAGRSQGAAVGPRVVASQVRHWLVVVAIGVVAAIVLAAAAAALGPALAGAALPLIVVVAALGALMTVAGVVALVMAHADPSAPSGR